MTLKAMQGHKRPLLGKNHSRTFIYGPILMKICKNANVKTQFSIELYIYDLELTLLL